MRSRAACMTPVMSSVAASSLARSCWARTSCWVSSFCLVYRCRRESPRRRSWWPRPAGHAESSEAVGGDRPFAKVTALRTRLLSLAAGCDAALRPVQLRLLPGRVRVARWRHGRRFRGAPRIGFQIRDPAFNSATRRRSSPISDCRPSLSARSRSFSATRSSTTSSPPATPICT